MMRLLNSKIFTSQEEMLFDLLASCDQSKLVVSMFAWGGNSYIGNEYWSGYLAASGDPAAGCCSNIPELLNPDIKPRVRGDNVHIAVPQLGIVKYLCL